MPLTSRRPYGRREVSGIKLGDSRAGSDSEARQKQRSLILLNGKTIGECKLRYVRCLVPRSCHSARIDDERYNTKGIKCNLKILVLLDTV